MKEQGFDFCPKCRRELFISIKPDIDIYEISEKLGLDCSYGGGSDSYIGFDLESGTNVENTIEELRKAEKKLKELFGDNVNISVHSGVTYS